jgi:cbb3-type cytochrome oxidase subunit 3
MQEEATTRPTRSSKAKLIPVLLILVLVFVGYVYYWYSAVLEKSEHAQVILSENEDMQVRIQNYILLKESIENEYNRCQEFISQREGDFGSFEYCKKFIEWANTQQAL